MTGAEAPRRDGADGPRKVVVLTDPGQDEAAAILMMLGCPERFDVQGLVATAGNVGLGHSVRNCLRLLELAGRADIPVFAGAPAPLRRKLVTAEHVHGPTGLDGPDLPEPATAPSSRHAVEWLIETLRAAPPGGITICSLSPMTNLALALVQAPDIADRIAEIVAMAGAYFEVGNITPSAEFNVYVDPDAADIVFRAGIGLTLLPLDVTHGMRSTPARLDAMAATGTACGIATAQMLRFSEAFDLKKYGWDGAPLHAPCVPAFLIDPSMFRGRQIAVSVETASELTMGMTVADWWRITDRPRNAFYVREGAAEAYYALINRCLARLP